jgi:PleD family two-component response regulator
MIFIIAIVVCLISCLTSILKTIFCQIIITAVAKEMVSLEHNFNRRQNYVKHKTSQKRILVIDDDPDITLTFKLGLERNNDDGNKSRFEIYTCNNPLVALSNFKPNFFDLMLVDINMSSYMDGFEFCERYYS